MNKTLLAVALAALLICNALGVRIELGGAGRQSAAAQTAQSPGPAVAGTPGTYAMAAAQTAPTAAAPAAQPAAAVQPPLSPQQTYMQDQAAVARINSQIDAMLAQPNGGFAVTYYAKPAPPPREERGRDKNGSGDNEQKAETPKEPEPGEAKLDRNGNPEKYVIARAGDWVYATLDRAFNSDDVGAPIFATIHDVDEVGVQGPLDGVRMIGQIKYSPSQAAIKFETAYLPDGRPIEVKGLAVSEDTARTGIAKNVDTHDLQRYGGLLLTTLVQGVGQVGQTLVQNNQTAMVDPATGLLVSQQKFNPYESAAGALLPAGQALTAVAAQGFNKPATISAPAGYGMGIVFLQNVVVPADLLFAKRR